MCGCSRARPDMSDSRALDELAETIRDRLASGAAESSYVARLGSEGRDAILKKVGEEAAEVIIAGKNADSGNLVHELADLWFHCAVLMAHADIAPEQLYGEIARRAGTSGIAEKASRGTSSNGA